VNLPDFQLPVPANPPDAGTIIAVQFGQDWIPALLTVLEVMRSENFFVSAPSDIQEQIDELNDRLQNTMIIQPQTYPVSGFHFHCNSQVIAGSAIGYFLLTSNEFNGNWAQTSAVIDNAWRFHMSLAAGTYTVTVRGQKFLGAGKMELSVDGGNSCLIDMYNATTLSDQIMTATLVIDTDGEHVFDAIIHGKNTSSTGYGCTYHMISLLKN